LPRLTGRSISNLRAGTGTTNGTVSSPSPRDERGETANVNKIMHIGDLHVGYTHRYLGARAAERSGEALETLKRISAWATDDANGIKAVLIAGDLFERHDPDRQLAAAVQSILEAIPASGRTLVTVPGNHDEYSYPDSVYRRQAEAWPGILATSPLPAPLAVVDLDTAVAEIYAMAFTAGLSAKRLPLFGGGDSPPDPETEQDRSLSAVAAGDKPRVRIAVLHGTLDADPSDRSFRIDRSVLNESGVHYAALGHIHKPAEFPLARGLAVYPGTLNGKGFDDPGVDHLTVVSFPTERPHIERVSLGLRRIETRRIDLSRFRSQDELISDIETDLDAARILRVELLGSRPPDYDAAGLAGRLSTRCFHFELDDQSIHVDEDEIRSLAQQPTLRGLFVQKLREQMAAQAGHEDELARLHLALRKGLTAFGGTGRAAGVSNRAASEAGEDAS
jgi:DNA repair protein SbcD/Mre11